MTALDGPACSSVEFYRWTVEKGLRAFAAHLIQAPALSVSFIAPLLHKLSGIKMSPSFTIIMDSLSMRKEGALAVIKDRK